MKNELTKTIAKVNNVEIKIIENGEKYVPIKPICEALGIDEKSQREKINNDEILSSVKVLNTSTGKDGKQYKMFSVPLMYVFGWIFTINPKNVKPEAKENIIKYKQECYKALYMHFAEKSIFIEEKQKLIEKELSEFEKIQQDFQATKEKLKQQKEKLNNARTLTFEQYKENKRQLEIPFN